MRPSVIAAAAILVTLPFSANAMQVNSFDLSSLHLAGSYCSFGRQNRTVLASDWSTKFWMKIDGKIIELAGTRSDPEIAAQLTAKRWRETLKAKGVTVLLNLAETGRGEDSAAFKGTVDVEYNGASKRLQVDGGCGA